MKNYLPKQFLFIAVLFIFLFSLCGENENVETSQEETPVSVISEVANWDGCMVSAYIFQEDGRHLPDSTVEMINEFEKLIEHELGSIMWYPTFADPFPTKHCNELKELGIIPHLTWELFYPDTGVWNTMGVDGTYKVADELLAGNHDAYIEQFAKDAKAFEKPIMIRFLHEFNGNWYVWSGNKNGRENGGPEKVVSVWKYVVDKFNEIGADNVQWIWNPHGPSTDVSEEEWNHIANYWPGDEYVDWIGMDAYNWYPKDPWGGERPFRDFDNCFRDLYDECVKLGDHPIMIAEFGSPEFEYEGMTKADWIEDAFNKIEKEYPKIKLFVWFHINKELDWRINSSQESLVAFKTALKNEYFIGRQ